MSTDRKKNYWKKKRRKKALPHKMMYILVKIENLRRYLKCNCHAQRGLVKAANDVTPKSKGAKNSVWWFFKISIRKVDKQQ